MSLWKAVVLGLVQGLTEFLPISSSGHLILLQQLFHVNLEAGGLFFDVMVHFGTLLAIFVAFGNDISHLVREGIHIVRDCVWNAGCFFRNFSSEEKQSYRRIVRSSYRKYVVLLVVSTIPTGVLGFVLQGYVEQAGKIVLAPACCLLVTALFLVIADLVETGNKKPKDVTYRQAALIGLAQGIAAFPGVSRSGTTITACLLCGFDKKFAVKYSFIMSIPAVLGAVCLELGKLGELALTQTDILYCMVATMVAAISGYLAIRFMMGLIWGRYFKYFAIYCAVVGIAAILCI